MAPPPLEKALAYSGDFRWLSVYWEPELNQLCYADGQLIGVGSSQAWQLFRTHPQVKPLLQSYNFGDNGQPAQHYLLLDRETRRLYVGESVFVEECLKQPQTLNLLAAMDANNAAPTVQNERRHQPYWEAYRTRTMIVGITLLLLLGLPAIGFGSAVILEDKDWLELEMPE